jgi:uncharacterized protein (DUF736 family)
VSKRPDWKVLTPVEQSDGKTKWYDIGVAWSGENTEGKENISIHLDLQPVGGKLLLVRPEHWRPS